MQPDVVAAQLEADDGIEGARDHVAVRQADALRLAGGAARVVDLADVVELDFFHRGVGLAGGKKGVVVLDQHLDMLSLDGAEEGLGDDQRLCAGIVENVLELRRREARVERQQNHAGLRAGVIGLGVAVRVDVEDADAVSALHALGLQRADQHVDAPTQLFEGEALLAIPDGEAVGI